MLNRMKDMMPFDNITKIVIAILSLAGLAVMVVPQNDPLAAQVGKDPAPATDAAQPALPPSALQDQEEAEDTADEGDDSAESEEDGKAHPRDAEDNEDFSNFGEPTLDADPLGSQSQGQNDNAATANAEGTAYTGGNSTPQVGQIMSEGTAPAEN
jgi:hypothetical protein